MTRPAAARGNDWSDRRVLVTGATGIVGSWVVKELLDRGAHVVALVLDADPQSEFYRSGAYERATIANGALEERHALERAVVGWDVDTVLHLGAQTLVGVAHRAPWLTFEANVRGTYNLLEVCRIHANQVRSVVVASSDKAYGEQPTLPYVETMPLSGRHPYEVSKSCADLLAQSYAHTYGLPIAVARCGNVYGGGDLNWSRLVPGTIRAFHEGCRPVIRSDGRYERDYIYVVDVARAYLDLARAVESDRRVNGEAFNFSTEEKLSVLEMVEAIRGAMGVAGLEPDVRNEAAGEIRHQHLSAAKARERLGWRPRFALADGLAETVAWYRSFLNGSS